MSETNSTTPDVLRQPRPDASSPGLELLAPFLCLIGLCIATYLTILHYSLMLGDLSLGGVCGGGTWGDCNSVVASRYGKLLTLPVSVWGMWYYICAGALALALLMLRRQDAAPFVRALIGLTAAALLFDVYLAWTMWRYVGRMCPLCVITYGVNVFILLIAVRFRRKIRADQQSRHSLMPSLAALFRPAEPAYYREVFKTFLAGATAGSCLLVLVLAVAVSRTVVNAEKDKLTSLLQYVRTIEPLQVATEGRPSRGPDDAPLTIVVFSDFLCQQCRTASEYLDIVAANHRDSMRIVYMHYPVDAACNKYAKGKTHPGACKLARAAQCAYRQGGFWTFHDLVFTDPGGISPERVTEYAARSGLDVDRFNACVADAQSLETVQDDIALAHSVGVTATPTLYVNGRPLIGAVKPWMLEAAIDAITHRSIPADPASSDNE